MTSKTSIPGPSSSSPFDPAPPPYDDSLQTPLQGTSAGQSSNLPFAPRPPLDPEQYALYTTTIPDNVEQLTYPERLVSGIETTTTSKGDVVTHDPRLHDPAALEAFIKQQASIPPTLKIVCTGHHQHQRHFQEHSQTYGDFAERNRSHNEIVVDFNFEIDLTSILESTLDQRTLTTARPDRAVPRGTFHSTFHPDFKPYGPHYREHSWFNFLGKKSGDVPLDLEDVKSRATKPGIRLVRQEKKLWTRYIAERFAKGLPPWTPLPDEFVKSIQDVRDRVSKKWESRYHRSVRRHDGTAEYARLDQAEDGYSPVAEDAHLEHATLFEWCQEFCRSRQSLREFRLQKHVYGWEPGSLLVAIRAAIASTDYQGNVQVNFVQERSLVTVYPDSHWRRWLAKKWVVVLLWLTLLYQLLYPFFWLYKRLFAGGSWIVANAHYPLKCYAPYDPKATHDLASVAGNREIRLGPPSSGADQPSLFQLNGYKEGRFMKRWESRIKNAVERQAGANGVPELLGDALLVERQDAEGRQVIRALDGYESA